MGIWAMSGGLEPLGKNGLLGWINFVYFLPAYGKKCAECGKMNHFREAREAEWSTM